MPDTPDVGPLARLMIDNAPVIEKVIDEVGPSAVAEFFINAGTGIALAYDLTITGDGSVVPIPEETGA